MYSCGLRNICNILIFPSHIYSRYWLNGTRLMQNLDNTSLYLHEMSSLLQAVQLRLSEHLGNFIPAKCSDKWNCSDKRNTYLRS